MIKLTKLDGETIVVNAELIESIGATPETLLTLTNSRKIWVRETPEEVVRLSVGYQALVRCEVAAIAANDSA